jgi:dihydrodipicolinate synthase/N-acetylneuraminate lyase
MLAEGNLIEAQRIQSSLLEPDFQILSRGAAGLKAALELLGYDTGRPRSPSLPCDSAAVEKIRKAMEAAGLL